MKEKKTNSKLTPEDIKECVDQSKIYKKYRTLLEKHVEEFENIQDLVVQICTEVNEAASNSDDEFDNQELTAFSGLALGLLLGIRYHSNMQK